MDTSFVQYTGLLCSKYVSRRIRTYRCVYRNEQKYEAGTGDGTGDSTGGGTGSSERLHTTLRTEYSNARRMHTTAPAAATRHLCRSVCWLLSEATWPGRWNDMV